MTSLGPNHASVVVPPSVNEVEILWQNTDVSDLSGAESVANLWGLDKRQIEIQDPAHTQISLEDPLTGPGIGHSEVHAYYQSIINQNVPPRPPGGGGAGAGGHRLPPTLSVPSGFADRSPGASGPRGGTPAPVLPLDKARLEQYFRMSQDMRGILRSSGTVGASSWQLLGARYVDVLDAIFDWGNGVPG
jgi:hypothetical protein